MCLIFIGSLRFPNIAYRVLKRQLDLQRKFYRGKDKKILRSLLSRQLGVLHRRVKLQNVVKIVTDYVGDAPVDYSEIIDALLYGELFSAFSMLVKMDLQNAFRVPC
jgi:hypothetical protein